MDFKNVLNVLDKDGNGFDFNDLKNIKQLDLKQLLSGDFLKQFTKFASFDDLLAKVGVSKPEALVTADPAKLDKVVKENSSFGGWKDMLAKALNK
jgi:hypothetical protein